MSGVVRRFLESVAWLLIGLMFLYTVLQSLGVLTRDSTPDPLPHAPALIKPQA